MTDAAQSKREQRLWLALGVCAVMQLATMGIVAALVLSPQHFHGSAAAPHPEGRRAGRQLLAGGAYVSAVLRRARVGMGVAGHQILCTEPCPRVLTFANLHGIPLPLPLPGRRIR